MGFDALMKQVCNQDCSACEYCHSEQCQTCSEDNDNFYPVQEFFDFVDIPG